MVSTAPAVALDLSESAPFSNPALIEKEFETRYLVGFARLIKAHQDIELELTLNEQGGVREARLFRGPRKPVQPLDERAQALARKWLHALSSESFDEREEATRALIGMGRDIEPLLVTNRQMDLETLHRHEMVYRAVEGALDLGELPEFLRAMQFGSAAAGRRFLLAFRKDELEATVPALKEFPLWNGIEPAESYAQRVGLPPRRTIQLKDGVSMEFILVPRARFTFGPVKPEPPGAPPEDRLVWAYLGGAALAVLAMALILRAAIMRRRWNFSLGYLFLFVLAGSLGLWGVVDWRRAVETQARHEAALREYNLRYALERNNAREVVLQRPFYLSKFEVTWRQYCAVASRELLEEDIQINAGGRAETVAKLAKARPDSPAFGLLEDDPREYLELLNRSVPGTFRLPSEAEWELACNGGRTGVYSFGSDARDLDAHAWYFNNIVDASRMPGFNQAQWNRLMAADPYSRLCILWTGCKALPKDVGMKAPNAMGFYDMHGNVWELCYDNMVQTNHAYRVEPQPTQEFLNKYAVPYVFCGGGFDSNPRECRSGYRLRTCAPNAFETWGNVFAHPVGFRVLMEVDAPKPFDPDHLQR
ncbi:MAG: formylglycine-generating enzyme family protein [Planctomycetota bacterium]|nr:formylglycine-generating enzyme family protein [Planctomycetota bacterium]